MAETKLSHLDGQGRAVMVDVGAKAVSSRTATAKGRLMVSEEAIRLILDGRVPKGDALAAARLAGIMAAKQTSSLIPLCHPLILNQASVDFDLADGRIDITATVKCQGQTGVEMEALTAVSLAALTLYDMLKAIDKSMRITDIRLVGKEGGRSGTFVGQ